MQTLASIGPRVVEKSLTEQTEKQKKTHSKTNTSPFALTSEWRVIKSGELQTACGHVMPLQLHVSDTRRKYFPYRRNERTDE